MKYSNEPERFAIVDWNATFQLLETIKYRVNNSKPDAFFIRSPRMSPIFMQTFICEMIEFTRYEKRKFQGF